RALARLAFTFLIVPCLTARRSPRADQMERVATLREHYHEQPTLFRQSEHHEAFLVLRMAWVVRDAAKWITEHRRGFLKRDLVLGTIGCCLRSILLEPQGARQLSVLMA